MTEIPTELFGMSGPLNEGNRVYDGVWEIQAREKRKAEKLKRAGFEADYNGICYRVRGDSAFWHNPSDKEAKTIFDEAYGTEAWKAVRIEGSGVDTDIEQSIVKSRGFLPFIKKE